MDGKLNELINDTITFILNLFGLFFFLMSLTSILLHGYFAGLLFILAATITFPSTANLVKKELNTSMTGVRTYFVVFCLVAGAFSAFPTTPTAVNNTTNNTTTIAPSTPTEVTTSAPTQKSEVTPTPKQNIENTPITFEEQLQNEIKLMAKNKVSYDYTNRALTVDLTEKDYWSVNLLKSEMFMDTVKILEAAATHTQEIKSVIINYKATLLDQNRNECIELVHLRHYSTTNTNPVNWENTYGDDREYMLRERADYFWLHPIFNKHTT
jgi:hypothetical protein